MTLYWFLTYHQGSKDAFKEETPRNFMPKFVKELVEEVLGNNKIAKMFQAMTIVS
jgi:hypothetical protein